MGWIARECRFLLSYHKAFIPATPPNLLPRQHPNNANPSLNLPSRPVY